VLAGALINDGGSVACDRVDRVIARRPQILRRPV